MKTIINITILILCSFVLKSQNICVVYNYHNDTVNITKNVYISDTAIIYVHIDKGDYVKYYYTNIKPPIKKVERFWQSKTFKHITTKSFREINKEKFIYYENKETTDMKVLLQGAKINWWKEDALPVKRKIKFTKKEKEVMGYLCKNAIITWEEGNKKDVFDVWYYKYPNIDNKYINISSMYKSIEGIVIEATKNGEKYQEVSKIIPNIWFNM
ncbi:MAG: hypothetical protein LBV69_07930 [Bacteroidales bacterium]|jgi:hypothetical protein|nr:hypothetical protein [Bacteroidales bacterium]